VEIAAGARHGLARLANGQVLAWGDHQAGQCDVPGNLPPTAAVFAGGESSAVADASGKLRAWGNVPPAMRSFSEPVHQVAIGSRTWVVVRKR
jgi:alpha-tubulin suppressor-like RCC1 family protein